MLILGCGYAGTALARFARRRELSVVVTVRSAEHASLLRQQGFEVIQQPVLEAINTAHVDAHTHVVVTFPPDGQTDEPVAHQLKRAGAITYVSTTSVYGERSGRIDDTTPVSEAPSEKVSTVLAAEQAYRSQGATVLRCPGLYGPDRGLHMRVISGQHRIPGDGSRLTSRLHVDDLAQFIVATSAVRGETFVVGDECPGPHLDVVRWICQAYGVPHPPSVPLDQVHETLRAHRSIQAFRALGELRISLAYPSYREGMAPAVIGIHPTHIPHKKPTPCD